MKVLKFGGSSLGTPERLQAIANLIKGTEKKIIVLSAVQGTTNSLIEIAESIFNKKDPATIDLINTLKNHYTVYIKDLYASPDQIEKSRLFIDFQFETIKKLSEEEPSIAQSKLILAQGEIISTTLFHYYLEEIGIPSVLLPALDFMKIDQDNEPMIDYLSEHLITKLNEHKENKIFITQGYICRNYFGAVDNLRRGGSDYSASLIGSAIKATEIQIWTDIDGMHNNDPRIVHNTKPIAALSFNEAAELAYFGAKILHPQSVFPAQKYKVPVRLLNTLEPEKKGTIINENGDDTKGVKAIAAKDDIVAIRIHSSRMLLAYGFLRKIFEIFERYKTPIDMITTSEVAVSLTIDNTTYLDEISKELLEFGSIEIDRGQTIICIVGNLGMETHGYASRVLDAIKHLSIRMISYGGSSYNISVLLDTTDKVEALKSLHNRLF